MSTIAASPERGETTYVFEVVVKPDEDAWHAYCPALVRHGGATWGRTREEALANITEVVRLVVESLREHGEAVPAGSRGLAQASGEPVAPSRSDGWRSTTAPCAV
jgi:predicted RNase H-like HicB family nuclease